ncbi:MAG: Gfo/Idh/MocA family protein, partial [Chitinophagaceae bacterium]
MKKIYILGTLLLLIILFSNNLLAQKINPIEVQSPLRPTSQKNVLELKCPPLDTVRIALIGIGMRGYSAIKRFKHLPKTRLVAIVDINPLATDRAIQQCKNLGIPKPAVYLGKDAWKTAVESKDINLVYICTPWDSHTPIAVYSMKKGKHVAIEVPAAMDIKECWDLVNTAEQTRKHCMMLENCNYDFFELNTLNMAQKGLFGEIVHGEGAYIHDLRWLNFANPDSGGYWDYWRLKYNTENTGNPYPTHGLGPIAHAMNIHRGDKLNQLVSMSTGQFGMTEYSKNKFGDKSTQAKTNYQMGDMNTTLIRTEKGKTIMIQHDVT